MLYNKKNKVWMYSELNITLQLQQVQKGCEFMYNIVVLSDNGDRLKAALPETENLSYSFTMSPDVKPDTECVLVSQDYSGAEIDNIVKTFKKRGIPCAVATFDGSEKNKSELLSKGITDIIVLPMSDELLVKELTAIISSQRIGSDDGFEMFAKVAALDDQKGAFVVHESNFTNLYRFVKRLTNRMEKPAYLVKFTFSSPDKGEIEPGALEEAFLIIKMCLRRGDIVSIYGNSLLAILIGADAEGAKTASQRIVDTYQGFGCYNMYDMAYDMQEIK